MGLLGTSSTLIPMERDHRRVDARSRSLGQGDGKNGPAFNDDREITPEYENEVRSYYGLGAAQAQARLL
jgi:hypothetical protein